MILRSRTHLITLLMFLSVQFLLTPLVGAQWTTQTIQLRTGWNAVYVELRPYPSEAALQLEGLPIERIWTYEPQRPAEEFLVNPNELLEKSPAWRVFFPSDSPQSIVSNLFTLEAGRAYLIKASEEVTWNIQGRPLLNEYRWQPDAYNLVGFSVSAQSPPTFGRWFEASPAHLPLDVWTLQADGTWTQIFQPSSTPIEPGRAYWIYTRGTSNYQGLLRVVLPAVDVLHFVEQDVKANLEIRHLGGGARTVTVSLIPSAAVPAPVADSDASALLPFAGDLVLTYRRLLENGQVQYPDLPASLSLADRDVQPRIVELSLERRRMTSSAEENAEHQGLLLIQDEGGMRLLVPVTAAPRNAALSKAFKTLLRSKGISQQEPPEDVGLWMGEVVVNKVSEPQFLFSDPEVRQGTRLPNIGAEALTEAPVDFHFTLILHHDVEGETRLLNQVTQLYRHEVTVPDPNNPSIPIVVEEGRPVLMTEDAPKSLVDEIGDRLTGSTLRDGRPFANRITSPMFSLRNAEGKPESPQMNKSGSLYDNGTTVELSLLMGDSDPRNPFRHQYHPQHRYLTSEDVVTPLQRYDITRTIRLTVNNDMASPDGIVHAGLGDTLVQGVYQESILGLRHDPIFVEGFFRLYRVSRTPVLNDGLGFSHP